MTFRFSGTLLRFVDFNRELELSAASIDAAFEELVRRFPELRPVLYDGAGNIRTTHRLFLNGEQLRHDELARPLKDDDCVDVLTAIAGG